jgi:hypothetical protein
MCCNPSASLNTQSPMFSYCFTTAAAAAEEEE